VDEGWVQQHEEEEAALEAALDEMQPQPHDEELKEKEPGGSAPRYNPDSHTSNDNPDHNSLGSTESLPSRALLPSLIPSRPTRLSNLFAVISDDKHSVRSYPWGDAGVYDKAHSDLPRLQELLFEQHQMQQLKEATDMIYREAIRKRQEVGMVNGSSIDLTLVVI
jgi:hypothetical protein